MCLLTSGGESYPDRQCAFPDGIEQRRTPLRAEQFGIIQAGQRNIMRQDHCGGDHRTRPDAYANFIDAGDGRTALLPQVLLE